MRGLPGGVCHARLSPGHEFDDLRPVVKALFVQALQCSPVARERVHAAGVVGGDDESLAFNLQALRAEYPAA